MTRTAVHSLIVIAMALAGAGCPAGTSRYKPNTTEDGLDRVWGDEYMRRPLQVGRSYEYNTVEQNTFTQQGGDYDPAISPDGKWMLFASTCHSKAPEIYLKTVNGSTLTRLTNGTSAEIQPSFSPDGKSFAYATNKRGNWDIWIGRIDGGTPIQETSSADDEISPCFHPNGKAIAYSKFNRRQGRWEIAVKQLGSMKESILGEGLYPRFSPKGDRIAFQRARTREPRWYSVWTIDVADDFNTSKPTEVVSSANWAAINPAWSPDGRYIAFATVHESPLAQMTQRILLGDDIWVVNVEGQDLTRITDSEAPESHPAWGLDEKGRYRIYFCSMMKGPKNVWSMRPVLPEPFGSVSGPLPGPKPVNAPPEKEREEAPPAGGGLQGYLMPPAPATASAIPAGN